MKGLKTAVGSLNETRGYTYRDIREFPDRCEFGSGATTTLESAFRKPELGADFGWGVSFDESKFEDFGSGATTTLESAFRKPELGVDFGWGVSFHVKNKL